MNTATKKIGKDPIRSIRVPENEWRTWQRLAQQRGLSIAALIRQRMAKVKERLDR